MNTRREIVKAGVGLAAIIAAGKAPASVVKSMIGMRNLMIAGGGGWQNPYVTDGLVAMWDGEWNAGPGAHDASSQYISSLIDGGGTAEIGSSSVLQNKFVDCSRGGGVIVASCPYLTSDNRNLTKPITVVLCMKFFAYIAAGRIIRLGLTGNDTMMYSNDGYNLKWGVGGGNVDLSSISPSDNVLATVVQVCDTTQTRYYCNGNVVSTGRCYWCIGGGVSFLCNGAFNAFTVNGAFYNAMVYNRAISSDEINAIHAVNMSRYGS